MKRARVCAVVVLACLSMGFVGCGNPRPDLTACQGVTDAVMRVIEQRLDTPGSLRHGRSVTSDESGITFVSAELVRAVDDPRDRGDLLTWAKAKVGGGFVAVDEDARKNSSWPNASFDVRQAGAIESRACAAVRRGKTTECDGPGAGLAQQGGQGAGCTERSR